MEVNPQNKIKLIAPRLDSRSYLSEDDSKVQSDPKVLPQVTTVTPTTDAVRDSAVGMVNNGLEAQIIAKYPRDKVAKILLMSKYVGINGLTLHEACLLVQEDIKFIEQDELLQMWFEIKELEFKKELISVLSEYAQNGDKNLAMWLLERKYAEEYGTSRKPKQDNSNKDTLDMAIEFVKKSGDSMGIVNESSAKLTLKGNSDKMNTTDLVKRLQEKLQ
jgi:hypothetical protein